MASPSLQPPPGPHAEAAQRAVGTLQKRQDLLPFWSKVRAAGDELVDRAAELCAIPAPTFHEQVRGDFVAQFLTFSCGIPVESDALGNRWIRMAGALGSGPRVMVSAHLDTVFPAGTDCAVRRENGRVIGPGIGDNCTGLSLLLTAAKFLAEAGRPFAGELIFAANVGEEGLGNLNGIRALCERLAPELDATLALDGGLGHIVGAAVGSVRYRVKVSGPGGHSWSDFGKPSAIHHLSRIAAELTKLEVPVQPRTTFNVGMLGGGTSINTIAPEAELLLDLRSIDPLQLELLDARARRLIEQVPVPPELAVQVEDLGRRPTGDPAHTTDWVDVGRAAWTALNVPVKVTASSTDANVPLALGLRASTIGTHRGGGAHTESEWIEPSTLVTGFEALLLALLTGQAVFPAQAARTDALPEAAGDD